MLRFALQLLELCDLETTNITSDMPCEDLPIQKKLGNWDAFQVLSAPCLDHVDDFVFGHVDFNQEIDGALTFSSKAILRSFPCQPVADEGSQPGAESSPNRASHKDSDNAPNGAARSSTYRLGRFVWLLTRHNCSPSITTNQQRYSYDRTQRPKQEQELRLIQPALCRSRKESRQSGATVGALAGDENVIPADACATRRADSDGLICSLTNHAIGPL